MNSPESNDGQSSDASETDVSHDAESSSERFVSKQTHVSQQAKDRSLRISVDRAGILSTTAREGNEELEDLDVEAYDQQTYEQEVFSQVNRAIAVSDDVARRRNDKIQPDHSSKVGDLMRLIHNDSAQTESDEQTVQLARLQRLSRTIKTEKPDDETRNESSSSSLKIPRLSKSNDHHGNTSSQKTSLNLHPTKRKRTQEESNSDSESSASEYVPSENENQSDNELDENIEYETGSEFDCSDAAENETELRRHRRNKIQDDGDFSCYRARLKTYARDKAKTRLANVLSDGTESKNLDELVQVEGNLRIPKDIWDNLFEHQRTGVRWLWELHQLGTGGILGDEMGLGKTIQMIAFLAALRSSDVGNAHREYENLGPTVLVCPATVMHQWLLEFRKWWPPFRVAILHNTGNFSGDRKNLVQVVHKSRGILIVSYPGVIIYQDYLHGLDWHYAILDEGHKIRNPDAQVTLACKRFRTPHRIILSGSPVQNNLKELWSIFDFIYPGKLGTLPVFMEQFATPITQGGYANASDFQVQIAYKCSCVLRDTIKPFLLRRTKAEVNSKLKLPDRSEQVLFCKLTAKQRKLYQAYLESPTIRDIKAGLCQIFVGLIQLRKICNHPDLFDPTDCTKQLRADPAARHTEFFSEDETYGHRNKSGKMMVVDALLKLWKKQCHKVLLFTQSRQMLKIFSRYLDELNYRYLSMDGATPIAARQALIEEFNKNAEIFVFLLTTRVGGVGINLTGANRIIIYDPDWNPSTDIQARERAWRIGQQRHVIIYRLLTAGTIEEKIYHRQVFKLYLTNRVLKDAKQKRFFKTNDLHELFRLGDDDKNIETKALFDDDLQINPESIQKSRKRVKDKKKKRRNPESLDNNPLEMADSNKIFSDEKIKAMREQAKRLSQMIATKFSNSQPTNSSNSNIRIKIEPDCALTTKHHQESIKVKLEPSSEEIAIPWTPAKSNVDQPEKSAKKRSSRKRVEYLVKQDIYKPDDLEDKEDSRHKKDDYILERLFKNSNIYGALKHDRIETDSTHDFKVVESEAEKVARDAIRALRESRRSCLDSSFGVPNWTGRNGQMAPKARLVPKNKSRVQSYQATSTTSESKDSLLSSIKRRNQANPIALAKGVFQPPNHFDDEEADKDFEGKAKETGAESMADKIRDYLLYKSSRTGEAPTDEMLEFFKNNFKPDQTAVFKAILYKLCEFERRGDKGFWLIRSEFRNI